MSNLFLDGSKLINHLDRVAKWQAGDEIVPVHVEISPSGACNQRCRFCYAAYNGFKKVYLEKELFLDLMRDMGEAGVRSCLFAGDGEPMLNEYTCEAIRAGCESGVDMALNTNGVLLEPERAKAALPYLTWLRFSMNSHEADTYAVLHGTPKRSHGTALSNIARAAEIKHREGFDVTIGMQQVLLPENASGVFDLASLAKDLGVDYFVVKPFSLHAGNDNYSEGVSAIALRDQYRDVLERAEALSTDSFKVLIRWNTFLDDGTRRYDRCLGLPFIAQIGADGHVYTCCPFFGNIDHSYGDLHKERFTDIWFGAHARRLRGRVRTDLDVHTQCMSYCRHHQINTTLWQISNPPDHVNFI